MRSIVVGINEQGLQRQYATGNACVSLVRSIQEVAVSAYDAVLICTSNENKYATAHYALTNKKHVLLEAPLWAENLAQLEELERLAVSNNVVFYVAYSYRFVDEFIRIHQLLQDKNLGEISHCRICYTAPLDNKHNGALIDLSPYILNLLGYWFGPEIMQTNFNIVYKERFSRQVIFADFSSRCTIEVETNFFASSNILMADIYGTRDSVHVTYKNTEPMQVEIAKLEYAYFQHLCAEGRPVTDCLLDKWIYAELDRLASEELLLA